MHLRPFQIFLLGTFGFLGILAIFLVKTYTGSSGSNATAYGDRVIIWGALDQTAVTRQINNIVLEDQEFGVVEYRYIDERNFDDEFVNAVAEGRSPDLIILKSDDLVQHRAKLVPVPYENFSARTFKDLYVDGAEIFMMADGIYAIPFSVDPLIMYWNRDLFASGGQSSAPTSWESLVGNVVPSLTMRDVNRNILQSAVGLGEYRNITNAKAILVALTMQSGSKMITVDERGYVVEMDKSQVEGTRPPMDAALEFYTEFSNSASPLYTWNRAQPSDKNSFISEDLAVYFGLGSEAENIANKNPNLNFDVAQLPQGAAATVKRTYGDFYGFAIPRAAYNKQGAYAAAQKLASAQYSSDLNNLLGMTSPYRSVIGAGDSSPYRQVMLQSALIARSWLDPDPEASNVIFSEMVEDVVSNRTRVGNAVVDAVRKLTFEY